ncbi:MAG: sigma-70 family RNA polymerase sigma factor [Actinomycetota bacterium]|nr:sigma-70 family RNA polymerase sigma factor [Actinomycetota bacterium]
MGHSRPPPDLEAFCRSEHARLVGVLALYCRDRELAQELAQDALVRLCRDWEKVRDLDHPEAWLHWVGLNLANSFFRRRAAEKRARQRLHPVTESPRAERSDAELLDALGTLPPRQKAALLLRYYADLSTRESAQALNCPEGTVKTLVHRGIKKLRESGAMTGEEENFDVG